MCGVQKNTVLRLLAEVGDACGFFHDDLVRGVRAKRIEADEIWSYCKAKERNVPANKKGDGVGDQWTWIAMDADTKLVISWLLAKRELWCARVFMCDLRERTIGRVQISTDGFRGYLPAIEEAFGSDADNGQIIKQYGSMGQGRDPESRYSPAQVSSFYRVAVSGNPVMSDISTSHVERKNLTLRMSSRRFTRLTNGYSKKALNLNRALALHFMYYNYVRKHSGIKGKTPALAAGLTDRFWTLHDLANLPDVLRNREAA